MTTHKTCDGARRRDLLKIGALSIGGLTMAGYEKLAAAGQVKPGKAERAIFIELPGGPSHMDTFDLKPNAPDTHRGTFNPIATNVPGIQISEHLPKLAACMDKFTILRGVSHTLAAHRLGREYVNTGSKPIPALEYPGFASVVSKELPAGSEIPSAVAVPKTSQGAGFLGIRYSALETNSQPSFGRPFSVRGISLPGGISTDEVHPPTGVAQKVGSTLRGARKERSTARWLGPIRRASLFDDHLVACPQRV